MAHNGFENADVVFITDGQCSLPENYINFLHQQQSARRFTVTGYCLICRRWYFCRNNGAVSGEASIASSDVTARERSFPSTVTGILLDTSRPGMEFSLEQFCQKIYRTSQLLGA